MTSARAGPGARQRVVFIAAQVMTDSRMPQRAKLFDPSPAPPPEPSPRPPDSLDPARRKGLDGRNFHRGYIGEAQLVAS